MANFLGATVEEAILSHVYIKDALTKCLDTSYIRNNENWQHLAYRQKVSADLIMKLTCQSPESRSEGLFQVLKTSSPDLTFGTLKHCLLDLENMTNVLECIKNLPGKANIIYYNTAESVFFELPCEKQGFNRRFEKSVVI